MSRSPEYTVPEGFEGKDLAGVRPCGCVTAALAIKVEDAPYANATEKDVRDFYESMARSGREVRWMPTDELRAAVTMICPHKDPRA